MMLTINCAALAQLQCTRWHEARRNDTRLTGPGPWDAAVAPLARTAFNPWLFGAHAQQ